MTADLARHRYAERLRETAKLRSTAVVEAFARVPREKFLGPGPWQLFVPGVPDEPWRMSPDANPEHVYEDIPVALDVGRNLHDGVPSKFAEWIDAVSPAPGERVLHVSCGAGYHTAILAELVGSSGRVVAYEHDVSLAEQARRNLCHMNHVSLSPSETGNDAAFDVIFVSAGVTQPLSGWLSALKPGGRMLLPFTVATWDGWTDGFAVRVERYEPRGPRRWLARVVSRCSVRELPSARSAKAEIQLQKLLPEDAAERTRWASTLPHEHGEEWCLVHLDGFCLQGD